MLKDFFVNLRKIFRPKLSYGELGAKKVWESPLSETINRWNIFVKELENTPNSYDGFWEEYGDQLTTRDIIAEKFRWNTDAVYFDETRKLVIRKHGYFDYVLEDKDELKQMLIKLITEREPYYKKADLVVNTERTPVGKTVDFIARVLESKIIK